MKVVFSRVAEQDLRDLYSYITSELQNPIAARNITTKILQRTQSLANFPEMGAALEANDKRFSSYRYLLVDNYLIIYKIADQVSVIRILYARSDYVQFLH
jgi:addiction module RelE/StbE family toxin